MKPVLKCLAMLIVLVLPSLLVQGSSPYVGSQTLEVAFQAGQIETVTFKTRMDHCYFLATAADCSIRAVVIPGFLPTAIDTSNWMFVPAGIERYIDEPWDGMLVKGIAGAGNMDGRIIW